MERLSVLRDGSVAYKLKYASKRRSHRIIGSVEFMARLACIIAPPRLPLTRYHGMLAPGSSWRRQIVPAPRASTEGQCPPACAARVNARPTCNAPSDAQPSKPAALPAVAPNPEPPKVEPPKAAPPRPRSRTSTSYVIVKILTHVKVPREPAANDDAVDPPAPDT